MSGRNRRPAVGKPSQVRRPTPKNQSVILRLGWGHQHLQHPPKRRSGTKMKITNLHLRKLTGTMETDGKFWEDRLARPIDIYPEYRRAPMDTFEGQIDDRHYRVVAWFVDVETDEGATGTAGPLPEAVAFIIDRQTEADSGWQRPRRHGTPVGSNAPSAGSRKARRGDDGRQRSRLRSVGSQGPRAEPTGAPPARRTDAARSTGLRQHVGVRGGRPRSRAGTGACGPGPGLHGTEVVFSDTGR